MKGDNTLVAPKPSSNQIVGGYMPWDIPYYYSIRVIRKNGVTETIVSDWQQAQTTWAPIPCDPFWVGHQKSATYNFPGWNDSSLSDQLVIQIGISSVNTGTPTIVGPKFVSAPLNTKVLKPHIFNVYYSASWMDEDTGDCYYVFNYSSGTNPSRIEITPVIN